MQYKRNYTPAAFAGGQQIRPTICILNIDWTHYISNSVSQTVMIMASLSITCNFKYSYAVTSDIRLCAYACVLTKSSSGKDSYPDNQLHLVLHCILNFFRGIPWLFRAGIRGQLCGPTRIFRADGHGSSGWIRVENVGNQKTIFVPNNAERSRETSQGSFKLSLQEQNLFGHEI